MIGSSLSRPLEPIASVASICSHKKWFPGLEVMLCRPVASPCRAIRVGLEAGACANRYL